MLAIARAEFLTVLRASQAAEKLDTLLTGDASDAALSMLYWPDACACIFRAGDPVDHLIVSCVLCYSVPKAGDELQGDQSSIHVLD